MITFYFPTILNRLLIVPVGIEINKWKIKQNGLDRLLIVPVGIEMAEFNAALTSEGYF